MLQHLHDGPEARGVVGNMEGTFGDIIELTRAVERNVKVVQGEEVLG